MVRRNLDIAHLLHATTHMHLILLSILSPPGRRTSSAAAVSPSSPPSTHGSAATSPLSLPSYSCSPTSSALSLICASCVHPPPLLPPYGVAVRLSPFSRGAAEAWQLAWIGAARPERPNCCRRPVPSGSAMQQPAATHGQARPGEAHRLPATAPGAERR